MTDIPHESATESHYDEAAEHYDAFNEANSLLINKTIETILKQHKVQSVLDMTCGTGSQVFYLTERGYKVTGSDFNEKMLQVARDKAKAKGLEIEFRQGDMRNTQVGHFDAVLTIFNAVGHLTKLDFEKAMRNIHSNLTEGGLYIFDINNLSYLLADDNITRLTIDWQKRLGETRVRDIQYSTIDEAGILASHTISYEWKGAKQVKRRTESQTLQVYTAGQLADMLKRTGFELLGQCALDGSDFDETGSTSIVMVARKR